MIFVDNCKLYLKAGNGGNGLVSWRKEKYVPEGGPEGGNGGDGASIIAIGDHNINNLYDLKNMKKIRADDGGKGDIEKCSGKNGATCYMHVPIGTSIYDANTNELIVDILRDKQEFVICQGGKGGKGNAAFKSSFNKVPTLHENGDLGEEKNVILKLRYIADVGLLGLPNAGKSTFISKVSNAKPKIANYQFTTLVPNLGSVKHSNRNIVFADIPGLIEGASEGKGLGHEFLKHIERCDVLIHLVSLNPDDNEEPYQAYKTILNELELYEHKLIKKPMYIVANKSDLDSDGSLFKEFKKHFKKEKIYLISALNNEGLNELLKDVFSKCDEIYQEEQSEEQEKMKKDLIKVIELKPEKDYAKDLTIEKDDDGNWIVTSSYMKYWQHKIPLDTKDNIIRFNQKLANLNVEEKIKEMGGSRGDTMILNGEELTVD